MARLARPRCGKQIGKNLERGEEGRKEEKRRGRRKTQTKGLQSTEEEELATLKALLLKGMVQKRERMDFSLSLELNNARLPKLEL